MQRAKSRGASGGGDGCHSTRRTRQNPGDDDSEKENPTTCRKQRPTKRGRPASSPLASHGARTAASAVAAAAPAAAPADPVPPPPPPAPPSEVTVALPTRGRLLDLALFEWASDRVAENHGKVPNIDALGVALPAVMKRDGVTARDAHAEATYIRTDNDGTVKRRRELADCRAALAGLPFFALREDVKLTVYYVQSTGFPEFSCNAQAQQDEGAALAARETAVTARETAVAPLAGALDRFNSLTRHDIRGNFP